MKKTSIVAVLLMVLMAGVAWAQKPIVAIMDVPIKAIIDQQIILDASGSLVLGNLGTVEYHWYVDGIKVGVGKQCPFVFTQKGAHRLELQITVNGQVQDTLQRLISIKQTLDECGDNYLPVRRASPRRPTANEMAIYCLPVLLYVLWLINSCP